MQANYANALCHLNATPLSVAVLAPCAWGENLVARQIRLGKRGESVAVLVGEMGKVEMGQCLGGGLLSLSLSLSLSLVARTFWQTKIFKRFIFGLLRPFCHFEPFAKRRKIQRIESALAILGYFANAQYDKFRQKPKFDSLPHFNVIKAHNDGGFCHFECSEKSKEFKIHFVYGYFANAQYDKKECSVWQTNPYYFEQSALAQSPHANLFDTLFLV